jgi:phenylpropionate dioxygenase-like ring-hydroxylating dioxygenase large terminal subunit
MTAMIQRQAYYDPAVFEREMTGIFATGFEFVGMASELANDKDFICVDYAGCAIVVQNFRGTLRAYKNVCSHRFNKIQYEDRGNRSLTCRYHGWTYNAQGRPIGVGERVEAVDDLADRLCLEEYHIERCGQFVFVRRAANDLTLREFLGEFHAVLEKLSHDMGPVIHFGTVPHKANWKVLVENVVDNTHCALLHKDSFVNFGFCRAPVEDVVIDGPHSSWHVPRTPMARDNLRNRALSHLKDRGFAHDSFWHLFIFPNLFLASTEGINFYIGHALPMGADETRLRVRYLEPRVDLSPKERARQDMLNEQTRKYGLDVVEEDRPILESIQLGARLAHTDGVMAVGEPRIRAFMDSYAGRMAGEAASLPALS